MMVDNEARNILIAAGLLCPECDRSIQIKDGYYRGSAARYRSDHTDECSRFGSDVPTQ